MGSLSLAEIMVILVVILVVFGPHRLPELSRRVSELLAKLREGTSFVSQAIDSDYGEAIQPIRELKEEYDNLKGDVTRAISPLTDPKPSEPDEAAQPPQIEGVETGEDLPDAAEQ